MCLKVIDYLLILLQIPQPPTTQPTTQPTQTPQCESATRTLREFNESCYSAYQNVSTNVGSISFYAADVAMNVICGFAGCRQHIETVTEACLSVSIFCTLLCNLNVAIIIKAEVK